MGIASFASLGAVIAIYFGLSLQFELVLPACAMAGAFLAAILLNMIALAVVMRIDYENRILMKRGSV